MSRVRSLGIIGLGQMGSPMARNLLGAGFDLSVYDINAEAMQELRKGGAKTCSSPEELARSSRVVFTILPDSATVREVVLGSSSIIGGMRKGDVLIEMSTRDLHTLKEIGRSVEVMKGEIIDAPVSGTPDLARSADLTVMASGKERIVNSCKPFLTAVGKRVFYVGKLGNGTIMKYANNLLVAVNKLAAFEATAFAVRAGIDPRTFYRVITTSRGNSEQFTRHVKNLVSRDLEPMRLRSWQLKDLKLINELSRRMSCPLFLGAKALQLVRKAVKEAGKETNESLWRFYERAMRLDAIP